MKTTKMNWLLAVFAVAAFTFSACNTGAEKKEAETKDTTAVHEHHEGEEHAHAVYVCPMKCENKQYAQAGKCDVCKMDLEKKSE